MAALKCGLVQKQIESLVSFLEPLLPLANAHMVDYFLKPTFDSYIPMDLKTELSSIGYHKAAQVILENESCSETPKLNEFIRQIQSFSLYNMKNVCLSKAELNKELMARGCKDISSLKLQVFVSPKKSHEVESLSEIAAALHEVSKTTHLIDIGDGKGYLSSMLALHYKIPVLGIDASCINTDGAVKRVKKLAKVWKGVTKDQISPNDNLYKQVTKFVNEHTNVNELISDVFLEESSSLGLVGLHTCGDLGSSSFKIFNRDPSIITLCNVSCCYNLLTEKFESEPFNKEGGFPLSNFLISNRFKLGRNARILSAQAVDRILKWKKPPSNVIFYRSLLEVILEQHNISPRKRHVGKLKKELKDFSDYAQKALKTIDANIEIFSQESSDLFMQYEHLKDQLNLFCLLRYMLAPVIESLILLDRLLYLYENQHENAFLMQLFDPVISPRCYGLIAFKQI